MRERWWDCKGLLYVADERVLCRMLSSDVQNSELKAKVEELEDDLKKVAKQTLTLT